MCGGKSFLEDKSEVRTEKSFPEVFPLNSCWQWWWPFIWYSSNLKSGLNLNPTNPPLWIPDLHLVRTLCLKGSFNISLSTVGRIFEKSLLHVNFFSKLLPISIIHPWDLIRWNFLQFWQQAAHQGVGHSPPAFLSGHTKQFFSFLPSKQPDVAISYAIVWLWLIIRANWAWFRFCEFKIWSNICQFEGQNCLTGSLLL